MKAVGVQVLIELARVVIDSFGKWSKSVAAKFRLRRSKFLVVLTSLVLVFGCAVTSERDLVNGGVEHYVGNGLLETMVVIDARGRVVSSSVFVVNATGSDINTLQIDTDEDGVWILVEGSEGG